MQNMNNQKKTYDFGGWATRNDLKCADGRTIRQDAFRDNDGMTVPLVWQHDHSDAENVLGHALLENRSEGVYAYCSFNNTDRAKHARELVKHGDISRLSIYANQLKQKGGDVLHGMIREVSLVLSGANPGAQIDMPMEFAHSDEDVDEAYIRTGEEIDVMEKELEHADAPEEKEQPAKESEEGDETIQDIFDTLNEKQKNVVYYMIAKAVEDGGKEGNEAENKEDENVKHNVFDNESKDETEVLSHSDMTAILSDAKRYGSLKDSVLAHGIEDIDILFPDAKPVENTPDWIKREDAWVKDVMNATHHTPFSRIKSVHANITEDDARALGYLPDHTHRDAKGNLVDAEGNPAYKKEEVFALLKRTTTPTTIYKKQKLDRDDVVDITDFDVVAWIKGEMRVMLDEELARAFLVGDGRSASSDDKINETNIRPIWKDDGLYCIKAVITAPSTATADALAKQVIRAAVKARKYYKGSGNPTFYTTEDTLTDMMLMEDTNQRVIYDTEDKLRSALRVSKIVTVPVMENLTRTGTDSKTHQLVGIVANLADYYVGADKGGDVNMFDDFDIDYNAQKYLIETRCSGALVKPYSAIAIEVVTDSSATAASIAFDTTSSILS